MPKLTIFFI